MAIDLRGGLIAARLGDLGDGERPSPRRGPPRPDRWRSALSPAWSTRSETRPSRPLSVLEQIGDSRVTSRALRESAHPFPSRSARRSLGRGSSRVASLTRVVVEDQGRVSIRCRLRNRSMGPRSDGRSWRCSCFLLTRPRFAATRDEVMDALWPDFDPADALNSLNQTVYFLRRVFEPTLQRGPVAGYVRHESDVIWLDRDLVDRVASAVGTDSVRCHRAIAERGAELSDAMHGPFALDFAYEEWADGLPISLHSSYLQMIEKAVMSDTAVGHFERGIGLARRALDSDARGRPNRAVALTALPAQRVSRGRRRAVRALRRDCARPWEWSRRRSRSL